MERTLREKFSASLVREMWNVLLVNLEEGNFKKELGIFPPRALKLTPWSVESNLTQVVEFGSFLVLSQAQMQFPLVSRTFSSSVELPSLLNPLVSKPNKNSFRKPKSSKDGNGN